MKTVLVFLFFFPCVHAQNANDHLSEFGLPLHILIQGEWTLSQIELIEGSNGFGDSAKRIKLPTRMHAITFTADSLHTHRDSTLRYYTRQSHYAYTLVYDSVNKERYINLYMGKRKKKREVKSYELMTCTNDDLVIKSVQFLQDGLDYALFSMVYRYKKNDSAGLNEKLMKHKWFYCSNQRSSFLNEDDSLTHVFSAADHRESCGDAREETGLTFERHGDINTILYTHSFLNEGVLSGGIRYMVDGPNNFIYIGSSHPKVYNIELLDEETLVLSLNKERTEKLTNTRNRRSANHSPQ